MINDEPEMGTLIDLGVSGIQSDYPGRLRKVALGRGCELEVHTEARRPRSSGDHQARRQWKSGRRDARVT